MGQELNKTSAYIILTVIFMLSSLPTPAPPALLLFLHHHHLLPPSLKFCLAYRRCPLLAPSLERETERERLDQNQRRSSCAPSVVSAKHSFSLVDQGTRKSNRYFPVSASCKKKKTLRQFGDLLAVGGAVCVRVRVCSGICWLIYVFMLFALGEEEMRQILPSTVRAGGAGKAC